MIIAGFVWATSNQDKTQIAKLQEATNILISDAKITERKHITVFTGAISAKNDKDAVIADDKSIVVGRIFHKQSYQPLTKSALECLSRNDADFMTYQYWGKYIYLSCRDSADKHITILRDPTGQLPFFYYQLPGGNIVFSSQLQILTHYLGNNFTLNWNYLNSYLLQGANYSTETVFHDIKELPPGCKLTITNNNCDLSVNWRPTDYYKPSQKKTNLDDSLIKVLKNSLKAWTNTYEDIYVNLNGDLNSAALLYSLHSILEPYQRLTAVTYNTAANHTKQYAENICKELGLSLLHIDAQTTLPFTASKQYSNLQPNKPQSDLILQAKYNAINDLTNSTLSSILVRGNGGANIFMSPPPINSIVDHILEDGWKGCGKKITALANYHQIPAMRVIRQNLGNLKQFIPGFSSKQYAPSNNIYPDWIRKQLFNRTVNKLSHPGHNNYHSLPGKRQHIASIYAAFPEAALELVEHHSPIYTPFLYQPALELALAIPSHHLYNEEEDQFPFRKAISSFFRADAIWHSKPSDINHLLLLGFKENAAAIKQLCLDGKFSRQDAIDRVKLESHINQVIGGSTVFLGSLVNLISAEMFLASWV